jgi:uncharacterized membrane protein
VNEIGKLLIFVGLVVAALGIVLMLVARSNFPLGRLPGDFLYRGKHTTFYFPLASSILISIVLSVILYLLSKFRH